MRFLTHVFMPGRRRNHPGFRRPIECLECRALLSGHALASVLETADAATNTDGGSQEPKSPVAEQDIRNGGFGSSTVGVPVTTHQTAGTSINAVSIDSRSDKLGGAGEKWIRNDADSGHSFESDTDHDLAGTDVDLDVASSVINIEPPVNGGVAVGNPGKLESSGGQHDSSDLAQPNGLDEVTFTILSRPHEFGSPAGISRGDGQGQTLQASGNESVNDWA